MTSLPPGDCCVKGKKHDGHIQGSMEKIGDIDTYVARPASGSSQTDKAIVIVSDVFGIYPNVQLTADKFAEEGYLTVVPDLFNGDAVSVEAFLGQKVDLQKWINGPPGHLPDTVDPIVKTVIDHLRTNLKVKRIGAVGYCYGGRYVVRFLKDDSFDVGYTAHPSFITEDELRAIQKPLSIAASEIDTIFTRESRYESEKILADLHHPYQISVYGAVNHGFALRGDLSIKEVAIAQKRAFRQAVSWFEDWL
ncbi:hypothetical protein BP6252_06633 [Coleophoma cylindrospora]|uniref:Dienelactone hydrolase domain-containing protein n=1 Tax=Coleophoma cylindrospora TaxID=1849047 RepID=A0A3D8RNV7_9HELO|nr:hypothetical protein BP6252_06633 [Coleophoma cylindrospora]